MQTITTIQLDIQQPEFIVVVHAMQQDEKTRYIAISMTEAGVAFTPPSGTLGVLAIRKPDGETCFYDSSNGEPAVTIVGSTATCLLVPEALQVAGDATAALVLYNAQGDRLSTFRFLLRIDPTPVPDEAVTSSSYYSILTQQIADAIAAGELAQQVIDLTVSATTLAAGSAATVTKTTSGGVVNLAFGIPQGIQGNTGATGAQGEPGEGVPTGGTTGQALLKSSAADYATAWNPVWNPNLLDNWDFKNPVNQRGVSGTISSTGYFIDRWQLTSGTVQLTANGLVLNGTITQTTLTALSGVTASVKMYSGTATATYSGSTFSITSSGGCVAAAKLETGSIYTIGNDAPASFPEQLLRCSYFHSRYAGNVGSAVGVGVAINSANAFVLFYLPSAMRIAPTVTQANTVLTVESSYSPGIAVTGVSSIIAVGNCVKASVSVASGLTAGQAVMMRINSGGYVDFDADL